MAAYQPYTPQLPNVRQLGTMLGLSPNQIRQANAFAQEHSVFFGEAAVRLHLIERGDLNTALIYQAQIRAGAAVSDMTHLASGGRIDYPPYLQQPNFGNNGPNAPAHSPRIDAISASAYLAQSITAIAAQHPELAQKYLPAVQQARALTSELLGGGDLANAEVQQVAAIDGLRQIIRESGYQPTDAKGNPVDIEAYLATVNEQITRGVADARAAAAQRETHGNPSARPIYSGVRVDPSPGVPSR